MNSRPLAELYVVRFQLIQLIFLLLCQSKDRNVDTSICGNIRHTKAKEIAIISSFRDFKCVCGDSEKEKSMLQKLFLALTITFALKLFLGTNIATNTQTATETHPLASSPLMGEPKISTSAAG